jgi:hypothetical protein
VCHAGKDDERVEYAGAIYDSYYVVLNTKHQVYEVKTVNLMSALTLAERMALAVRRDEHLWAGQTEEEQDEQQMVMFPPPGKDKLNH